MLAAGTRAGWWTAIAAVCLMAGVWALRAFDPNAAGNPFPSCVFHTLTGLWCPGCGLTRAADGLAHLRLGFAF